MEFWLGVAPGAGVTCSVLVGGLALWIQKIRSRKTKRHFQLRRRLIDPPWRESVKDIINDRWKRWGRENQACVATPGVTSLPRSCSSFPFIISGMVTNS